MASAVGRVSLALGAGDHGLEQARRRLDKWARGRMAGADGLRQAHEAALAAGAEELAALGEKEAAALEKGGALQARLAARPGSTDEVVDRRMRDAKAEMRHWRRYDYAIVNDDLEVAYQRLKRILLVERLKRLRQLSLEDHVRKLMGEA